MVVTTASRPDAPMVARAQRVAARCGARYAGRRGALDLDTDGLAYVVGRACDELRDATRRLSLNVGLLHARRRAGLRHPLIAALVPEGRAETIVDATLGLAMDALHIAAVLDCAVLGIEGSPAIFSLLEEGLPRLAREEPAAARIDARFGSAAEVLATLPTGSADAVYLSPMFGAPQRAAPGFELLRAVAIDAPLDAETLEQAARVARGRVVVKVAPGETLPVGVEVERTRSQAVDYVVVR